MNLKNLLMFHVKHKLDDPIEYWKDKIDKQDLYYRYIEKSKTCIEVADNMNVKMRFTDLDKNTQDVIINAMFVLIRDNLIKLYFYGRLHVTNDLAWELYLIEQNMEV